MIVDGKNRHYTAIKSLSRMLKSMNAIRKGVNLSILRQLLERFSKGVGERQALQVLLESWRSQRHDAWGEGQVVEVSRWTMTIQGTIHDVRGL